MRNDKQLNRARWMLGVVAFGLFLSGVTVWPAVPELRAAVRIVWGDGAPSGVLHAFVLRAIQGLVTVQADYPFMLYAHDWLAFAHIVLALLFAGAIRDPVRNIWIVQCGLIMCALVPVLAGVCIPLRGLPACWFWFDFAFAPAAAVPLYIALRDIKRIEAISTTGCPFMNILAQQLPSLLPKAALWAEAQEQYILQNGTPLSPEGLTDAVTVGVLNPGQIRVLKVDRVPLPVDPVLREAARETGLITSGTAGMSLRYGIFIRADHWGRRDIIVHECVHTAQYERLGGHLQFLSQYLKECVERGYLNSPLEQEAIRTAAKVVGKP